MARTKKTARMSTGGKRTREPVKKSWPLIISQYVKSVNVEIGTLPFQQIVRQITKDININISFQVSALTLLHIASEEYLVGHFEEMNLQSTNA